MVHDSFQAELLDQAELLSPIRGIRSVTTKMVPHRPFADFEPFGDLSIGLTFFLKYLKCHNFILSKFRQRCLPQEPKFPRMTIIRQQEKRSLRDQFLANSTK